MPNPFVLYSWAITTTTHVTPAYHWTIVFQCSKGIGRGTYTANIHQQMLHCWRITTSQADIHPKKLNYLSVSITVYSSVLLGNLYTQKYLKFIGTIPTLTSKSRATQVCFTTGDHPSISHEDSKGTRVGTHTLDVSKMWQLNTWVTCQMWESWWHFIRIQKLPKRRIHKTSTDCIEAFSSSSRNSSWKIIHEMSLA